MGLKALVVEFCDVPAAEELLVVSDCKSSSAVDAAASIMATPLDTPRPAAQYSRIQLSKPRAKEKPPIKQRSFLRWRHAFSANDAATAELAPLTAPRHFARPGSTPPGERRRHGVGSRDSRRSRRGHDIGGETLVEHFAQHMSLVWRWDCLRRSSSPSSPLLLARFRASSKGRCRW